MLLFNGGTTIIAAWVGNAASQHKGLQMKIEITLDNAEKVVIYGMLPLEFATAILSRYEHGLIAFQNKAGIEQAIQEHNAKKVLS